ncbi:hypothetical protein D3C80_1377600 [compost metagenome]
MPGLGLEQAGVELGQIFVQVRYQRGEALARTRLDKSTDHQGIGQPVGVVVAHAFAQCPGIARRTDIGHGNAALLDDAQHLFEMTQLFPGQARHFVQEVGLVVVLEHELERRPRCLLLVVGVVDQKNVKVAQGCLHPGIGCAAKQEGFDFRDQLHRLTSMATAPDGATRRPIIPGAASSASRYA